VEETKVQQDRELILECQKGNTQAFGALYDKYIKKIYDFIYYKTHHKETAEDLTSQTFFKVLNAIQSVDPNRSFVSWLYKIAQNTVIDYYRTKRNHSDVDDMWDLADGTDILGDLDTKAKIVELKKYMKKLSSLERDVVIMRVWQEMPYKEIAEVVGKSEANCKMIFSRSLSKLRDMMPLLLYSMLLMNFK